MDRVFNDDALLRRYLLGELAPDEEMKVEERLISDDDYIEQLGVVEDELIDSYARDDLKAQEREKFKKHFLVTPERRSKLHLAQSLFRHVNEKAAVTATSPGFLELLRSSLAPSLRKPALGAVMAILAIAFGFGIYYQFFTQQSDIRKGLQALNDATSQQRPVEPRISALNYAPYSVKRGDEKSKMSGQVRLSLDRAARIFLDLVNENPTPASYHAAGRYYLTQKDYVQAITQFNSALEADKGKIQLNNTQKAQLQSDYAVALMEKAKSEKEKDLIKYELEMAESRDHLEEALKLNGELPEALFNRALWLQERRLWRQAEEWWSRYLERDPSSPWAEDAKKFRERAIEESKKQVSLTPQEILRDFLKAYQANDKENAWQVLSNNREPITGRMVWWQLTEAFLDAANKGHADQAGNLLQALSYAGELELEKGDRFTSELAAFYSASSSQQHSILSQAHELTKLGYAFCLKSKYDDALDHFNLAKELFKQAGDELEIRFTEYWIAYCYLQQLRSKQSLLQLDRLARICARKHYLSLLVQVLNSLGTAHFNLAEYSKSNEVTSEAVKTARQISDTYGLQKGLAQLGNQHKILKDFDQSLAYIYFCLESAANVWPSSRQMWRTYDTLAQVLNALQFYAAAADYQKETLDLARQGTQDPSFATISFAHLSFINSKLQDTDEAFILALQGVEASKFAGARLMAYALLRLGYLYLETGDIRQALSLFDQSAHKYEELDDQVMVYSAYKGRLLCYFSQGNDTATRDELWKVLNLAEIYRTKILDQKHQNTFFDAEQSVYDIAIDFEYSRAGNNQSAFEYAEKSRARSLLDLISTRTDSLKKPDDIKNFLSSITHSLNLVEIQQRLPEQTQILQYALLTDKLLIWVISKTKFENIKINIDLSDLQDKVFDYQRSVTTMYQNKESDTRALQQAKALYKILIGQVESKNLLDSEKTICVVPDKVLNYLPFSALVDPDSGEFLINKYRMTFAPSSTVFLICSEWAQQNNRRVNERLLSIGNPSFNHDVYPALPASEREANIIADYYRNPKVLVGVNAREATVKRLLNRFDVMHVASHYVVDDRSPMHSKLLLAQEPAESDQSGREDGMLGGEEIYLQKPLHLRLVVLSACQSGVERYYNGEGMIGMSRTFIASGVPLVVASLWPVDSEATAELMINFHKYRKVHGYSTAEALRRAQSVMSGSSTPYRNPNYWASFIVIGGHASY